MQKVDFLKSVLNSSDLVGLLLKRPARFMIQESYIVGGVGAYVLGVVLCGVIKQNEEVVLQPGDLKSSIGFLEKERKLVSQVLPGESVAMNLPNIKTSKIKRGMVVSMMSDKPSLRAADLEFALGFFIGAEFKGSVTSGMKFFLVHNRISRKCRIEIQCLIDLESELIGKKDGESFQKGDIVFLKIFSEEALVLEDPRDFPEFSLVELRDNCQLVALGKIYKVAFKSNSEDLAPQMNPEKEEA